MRQAFPKGTALAVAVMRRGVDAALAPHRSFGHAYEEQGDENMCIVVRYVEFWTPKILSL